MAVAPRDLAVSPSANSKMPSVRSVRLINLNDDVLDLLLDDLPDFERQYRAMAGSNVVLIQEIAKQARRLMEHSGVDARWGGYLAADSLTKVVVGVCGFKARPSTEGTVEIGYFTFEEFEGHGYAVAMSRALIAIAKSTPKVRWIVARTQAQPGTSPHILEKVGMAFLGEVVDPIDGIIWQWELDANAQKPITQD